MTYKKITFTFLFLFSSQQMFCQSQQLLGCLDYIIIKAGVAAIVLVTTHKISSYAAEKLLLTLKNRTLIACVVFITKIFKLIDADKLYWKIINERRSFIKENLPLIKALYLYHNLEPDNISPPENADPFYIASEYGDSELLEILLSFTQHEAVTCFYRYCFNDCLALALKNRPFSSEHSNVVKILLSKNPETNLYAKTKKIPLAIAAWNDQSEMFLLCLNHKSSKDDINKYDFQKYTQATVGIIQFLNKHIDLFDKFFAQLTNTESRKNFLTTAETLAAPKYDVKEFIPKLKQLLSSSTG